MTQPEWNNLKEGDWISGLGKTSMCRKVLKTHRGFALLERIRKGVPDAFGNISKHSTVVYVLSDCKYFKLVKKDES